MILGIIGQVNEDSFINAQKRKLSFLEFDINYNDDSPNNALDFFNKCDELLGYVNKYNVPIGAIGRWGGQKINSDGSLNEQEIKNNFTLIDASAKLGSRVFITGVNFVEGRSYYQNVTSAIEYLERVVAYGSERGVKVCTYNCRWDNFINTPMAWTLIHGHIKNLGIKYDTSHAINAGADYLDEMKNWGDRFYHVHIKGTININGDHVDDPPAGLDNTNWNAVMGMLYKHGYDGTLSLEPHSGVWKDELGEKGIDYSIRFIKNFLL